MADFAGRGGRFNSIVDIPRFDLARRDIRPNLSTAKDADSVLEADALDALNKVQHVTVLAAAKAVKALHLVTPGE